MLISTFYSLKLRLIYITIIAVHFYIVRHAGFDADINTYANSVDFYLYGIYYWKEPLIWFGLQLVNQYTPSIEITFLTFDLLSVLFVYIAFKKTNLKANHFLGFFLLFPVILGYENIYRQYYSTILTILFISFLLTKFSKKYYFIAILAGTSHNVSFAFTPIFSIFSQSVVRKFLIASILIAYPILMQLASTTKSFNVVTGNDLALIYLIILFLTSVSTFLPFSKEGRKILDIRWSVSMSFVICLIGYFILEPGISERFTMFAIMINLFYIWYLFERFWKGMSWLVTISSVTLAFIPMFLVEASFMLESS